ncbi:Arm DNA-binding domain-containing protein [Streptomyces sp. NPDC088727]|uniref:Arm DNA-binding domain-containing protein n=1 Tax=Streptomyces sp. NPDC088727 TaxID=3365875 RepID=UPI003806B3E5
MVRYRFVVDVGAHSSTGKRRQVTRTFGTLREAKAEYAHITHRRYRQRPCRSMSGHWTSGSMSGWEGRRRTWRRAPSTATP